MNRKHLSMDDLSAYLDGEARHPDALREHLQACPECARRYAEMARLSSHLRAMTPPEVSPAFATRVMATVREAAPVSSRRPWRLLVPAALGAAALVLLATVLLMSREEAAPARIAGVQPTDPDPDRLMAVIASRIAEGEDPGVLEDALPLWDDGSDAALASDADLAVLAQAAGWDNALSNGIAPDDDIDTMLSSLDPEEAQVFRQLLTTYASEG